MLEGLQAVIANLWAHAAAAGSSPAGEEEAEDKESQDDEMAGLSDAAGGDNDEDDEYIPPAHWTRCSAAAAQSGTSAHSIRPSFRCETSLPYDRRKSISRSSPPGAIPRGICVRFDGTELESLASFAIVWHHISTDVGSLRKGQTTLHARSGTPTSTSRFTAHALAL